MKKTILLCALSFGQLHADLISHCNMDYNQWKISLERVDGVDVIRVTDTHWYYISEMWQSNVTPSYFALTFNALKDALVNLDKISVNLFIDGSNSNSSNKLESIQIFPAESICE